MAKEFTFILGGNAFAAAPVKLERKKIYGWSSLVATDRDGHVCTAAYISPEDSLMIPSGAAKMATVDEDGLIVRKSDLVAFDAEGKVLETVPSSFDSPIDLTRTANEEEFLDWERRMKDASWVKRDVALYDFDRTVTLSTCTGDSSTRCVVLGKVVWVIRHESHSDPAIG